MRVWRSVSPAVLALVLLLPLPVRGQIADPPRERPRAARGLFGGVERDPARPRSLDLELSLQGGYDDNIDPERGGSAVDPRFTQGGGLGDASAALSYRRGRGENLFLAGVRAAYRYHPSISDLNGGDYGANVGFTVRPAARFLVSGRQDVSYQPRFAFSAVPVFTPAPASGVPQSTLDYSFVERPSIAYVTGLDGGYHLTRRTRASAGYSFRGLDFTAASDDGRMRDHQARVGVDRAVTRRWRVGGGYSYEHADNFYTGQGVRSTAHGGDLTVEYARLLRSQRPVTLQFVPGFRSLEYHGEQRLRRTERRATASVRGAVPVGRTWTVSADYRRGLRQLPAVRRSVFSDDAQVSVEGLVGRRTDFSLGAQYSEGDPGVSASGFTSLGGVARVRVALNRLTALTGNYVYYRYEFGPDAVLPPGFGRQFNRHAFRIGVDLWLPLFR